MRNKYIRFFISSTFDDMKEERKLLQDIFSELNAEYARKNWQIEIVDLRWGISQEAGLENKTMQICKEELKRCQQMSPKPNFVILLGDRYGWIPLPEVIPTSIYNTLQMTDSERSTFEDWYELDMNYLPEGAYIMKSRMYYNDFEYDIFNDSFSCIDYTDNEVWQREVEAQLSSMFQRNNCKLYGTSATEQEIELGALCVDDAHEHVIAYIRHLEGVPKDMQKRFQEPDKKDMISSLEQRIQDKLSNDNIISKKVTYNQYISAEFASKFKADMKEKLCNIITHVINEYEQNTIENENQAHIEYALRESLDFVGREKELNYIKEYLDNSEFDYGIWYQAPSGMGKSALLAKIIELYKDKYDIICRFCGTSELSSEAGSLVSSFRDDLKNYYDSCSKRLSDTSVPKPLLIIIDSLDRVDNREWSNFNSLQWINYKKDRNDAKIIISSTPELKYRIEIPFFRKVELGDLSSDALLLINSLLKSENRTLSDQQMAQLSNILAKSDKSPIYLKMLGRILSKVNSQQDLSKIPETLEGLVEYYCLPLTSATRHGHLLVSHILYWLATTNTGIVEKEVGELLALDKKFMEYLIANSKHELGKCEDKIIVPSILWARLRYDLKPLLRQENKFKNQLIAFFHPRIKHIIKEIFGAKQEEVKYMSILLYQYYTSKYPERHALLEGPSYAIEAYKHNFITLEEILHHMEEKLDYIIYKKLHFPKLLLDDYDKAIFSTNDQEIRKRIRQTKELIYSIESHSREQEIKMALRNMPLSSPLRVAMEKKQEVSNYMVDLLSYNPMEESIYIVNDIGKSPIISQDAKVLASLKDNNYKLCIEYLEEYDKNYHWEFPYPVIEIQMDDNASYIAARTENKCFLLNLKTRTVTTRFNIDKNGWMSLAGNANRLFIGYSKGKGLLYNIENQQTSYYQNILHAKLSPSGSFFWYISIIDYSLNRYDLNTNSGISFTTLPRIGISTPNPLEELRVVSCSEECCIAGDIFVRHFACDEGKDKYSSYLLPWGPAIEFQHPSMFIHRNIPMWIGPNGSCQYINKDNKICVVGNIDLGDLQFINGDFTIALSATQGRIFDFKKELSKFRCIKGFFTNFNLSTSNDGNQIAVSSYGGTGYTGGVNQQILRVSNGNAYSWSPNYGQKYQSLPANALSPDGTKLAVSTYVNNNILIIDTEGNNIICKLNTPINIDISENIGSMKFTKDAEYLAMVTGNFISPVNSFNSDIFVYDINRKEFIKTINVNFEHRIGLYISSIIPSNCNRYLFLDGCIYDLIENKFLIDRESAHNESEIIAPATPDIYVGKYHYNLYTQKQEVIDENQYLSAISPSGLYRYYIKDYKLYVGKLQDEGNLKFLKDNVSKVFPTLDDRHIYILDRAADLILFDIVERKDLQMATKGSANLGVKVCAQGLVVFNNYTSRLSLFKPDEQHKVNIPAFTTFVRRWDIVAKRRKEATAICPFCGKLIEYKNFSTCDLKEYIPNLVNSFDWDNPKLKNHHCPHCNTEIQFTPYIT